MNLIISHGAFQGPPEAFTKMQQIVALAMGGSYPPHLIYDEAGKPIRQHGTGTPLNRHDYDPNQWVWGDGYTWESNPGLGDFFDLPVTGGIVAPEMCGRMADELESILPEIERAAPPDRTEFPGIAGNYPEAVRRFIYGCRRASDADEPLTLG